MAKRRTLSEALAPKEYKPSKEDCMAALNSLENGVRSHSERTLKLIEQEKVAAASLELYEVNNAALVKLRKAAADAERAAHEAAQEEKRQLEVDVRNLRNRLRLEGPNQEVVAAIQALVEEYQ